MAKKPDILSPKQRARDAAIILRDLIARAHTGTGAVSMRDPNTYRLAVTYLEDLAELAGLTPAELDRRARLFSSAVAEAGPPPETH